MKNNLIGLFVILLASFVFSLGCNPGTSECVTEDSYHTCTDMALWNETVQCDLGTTCFEGICSAPIGCKPGTSECVSSTTYHTCSDYALWNPEQTCPSGGTCSGGQCSVPKECNNYQQTRCNPSGNGELQTCNAQYKWEHLQWCSYGCNGDTCRVCTSGQSRCQGGDSYQVCQSDGRWSPIINCGLGYTCFKDKCVANSDYCATPGQYRCSPDDSMESQKCSNNYVWQDYQYCSNACYAGHCVACTYGQTNCIDSQTYVGCTSNGQWGPQTKCNSGYTCITGKCQVAPANACSVKSQTRCSPSNGNMLQQCDGTQYNDYMQCAEGCVNGDCAQCTPNTKVCAGALAYRTCTLNGKLSDPINCPSGYTCDNSGDCVATPQCTDGQRNCVSDTIYNCANKTWELYYQCPPDSTCKETQGTAICEKTASAQPDQPKTTDGQSSAVTLLSIISLILVLGLLAVIWYVFTKLRK